MKKIRNFYLKIFIFLVVKFSVYLNRHLFVMDFFLQLPYILYILIAVPVLLKTNTILVYKLSHHKVQLMSIMEPFAQE